MLRLLGMLLIAIFTPVMAISTSANDIAIDGYSPVSYFTKGEAERGQPRFAAIHDGKIYYLTSTDQMTLFHEDPDKYVPALGAHCPYSLALGRDVAIDPERFLLIDGRLYLFHKSEELDALRAWKQTEDPHDILERAEGRFKLLSF